LMLASSLARRVGPLLRCATPVCLYFTSSRLSALEEVERHRPMVPTLADYERPAKAPKEFDLKRDDFHKFMKGKPERFSNELRVFLTGVSLIFWAFGATYFTMYQLRPDDFGWVEEERKRLEAVKAKLQKIAAQQETGLHHKE